MYLYFFLNIYSKVSEMQILLPWKNANFHNTSHATKVYPKVQNNCRSNLMTGLLSSSLKLRISAYKMSYSKWWDTAVTRTESADSRVTARFSCGPEHQVVARSEVSFASSSAVSEPELSSTTQSQIY